jgi:hypothetical protein
VRYLVAAAVVGALGVRIARSRNQRFMHPDGRSFAGELRVTGIRDTGSALIDRSGRHPVTVRISKGVGTRAGWPDVLGLAVRVYGPVAGHRCDLLLSSAGRGRVTRHLPLPRRTFDARYGSILPYRTGTGRKIYLSAEPAADGRPLGRTLEAVVTAAERDGARLVLAADGQPFGTVIFGDLLPATTDAALAFDPVRNAPDDLHPTGTVHGVRALAYRLSQRWRGARPADPDTQAVIRTATHH